MADLTTTRVGIADVCAIAGFAAIEYGLARIAPPLAWVLAGGILILVGLRLAGRESPEGTREPTR